MRTCRRGLPLVSSANPSVPWRFEAASLQMVVGHRSKRPTNPAPLLSQIGPSRGLGRKRRLYFPKQSLKRLGFEWRLGVVSSRPPKITRQCDAAPSGPGSSPSSRRQSGCRAPSRKTDGYQITGIVMVAGGRTDRHPSRQQVPMLPQASLRPHAKPWPKRDRVFDNPASSASVGSWYGSRTLV